MYKIVVGRNSLDYILQQLMDIPYPVGSMMDLTIDFEHCGFIRPYELAVVASYVEMLRTKVDVNVHCVNIRNTNSDYVSRMNFFQEMGIGYFEYFTRHSETGRFIPIQRVSEANRYNIAGEMSRIMVNQWDGIHQTVITSLDWTIQEVTDNIFNHSKTPIDGFVTAQYYPNKNEIDFIVIDNGVGIPQRLKENPQYNQLSNQEALELATHHKVTVDSHEGVGAGLYYTRRIIEENRGMLQMVANNAQLIVNPHGLYTDVSHDWQGTIIRFVINTNVSVDPNKCGITFHLRLMIFWETVHFGKEVGTVIIQFRHHKEWLSSRQGGKNAKSELRSLILSATPHRPIVFDFEGIDSISSSFADELFGKLIAEMGFERFKAVTTFKNVSPFVANIIRNSIFHRNENDFVKV